MTEGSLDVEGNELGCAREGVGVHRDVLGWALVTARVGVCDCIGAKESAELQTRREHKMRMTERHEEGTGISITESKSEKPQSLARNLEGR